jgi:hypothetical protein
MNQQNTHNNLSLYKIKFFSDFCNSTECKKNFEKSFENKNKNIIITDQDDFTHAILLNKAMPITNLPKEKVIGLACEPFEFLRITPEFLEYAKKNIGNYLIGDKHDLPNPFIEHFAFMWYSRPIEKNYLQKNKVMSIVLSNKTYSSGHRYRHELVTEIQKRYLPIAIYGRGSKQYKGVNVKGEFVDEEPYNDYFFTICIENFQSNEYISEKALNPIMRNCIPLYLGAKNIMNYIKEVILLTGNIQEDIQIITNILLNPMKYYIVPNHENIMKHMNLFDNITQFFDN